jgi:hypothetical protein
MAGHQAAALRCEAVDSAPISAQRRVEQRRIIATYSLNEKRYANVMRLLATHLTQHRISFARWLPQLGQQRAKIGLLDFQKTPNEMICELTCGAICRR